MNGYVVASDVEEFGTKQTLYVKLDFEGICAIFVTNMNEADIFDLKKANELCRRLNHHNCEDPYYVKLRY